MSVSTTPTPTQAEHPWRATARTVVAGLVAVAASWGLIIEALGVDPGAEFAAATLAVAAAITRLMAVPVVNDILGKVGLSAAPAPPPVPYGYDDDRPVTR